MSGPYRASTGCKPLTSQHRPRTGLRSVPVTRKCDHGDTGCVSRVTDTAFAAAHNDLAVQLGGLATGSGPGSLGRGHLSYRRAGSCTERRTEHQGHGRHARPAPPTIPRRWGQPHADNVPRIECLPSNRHWARPIPRLAHRGLCAVDVPESPETNRYQRVNCQ